jgi:hypothetical protein
MVVISGYLSGILKGNDRAFFALIRTSDILYADRGTSYAVQQIELQRVSRFRSAT